MSTLASPASNGGRGLKLDLREALIRDRAASPASNGGRGLKPWNQAGLERGGGIARQQWRARIETRVAWVTWFQPPHRPPAMAGAD